MERSYLLGMVLVSAFGVWACGDSGTDTQPDTAAGMGAPPAGAAAPAAGAGAGTSASGTGGAGQGGAGRAAAGSSAGSGGKPAAGSGGGGGGTPAPAAGSGGAAAGSGGDAAGSGGSGGNAGSAGAAGASDGTDPNAVNPYPGFTDQNYAQDKLWMCKPGLTKNYCLENVADATEALPDGTFKPFMDELGTNHPIDCIFWYPTVNRSEDPESFDFSNPEPMLSSIRSQAARFSRVCNVYAPFYRQASLNNGGNAELGYMDVVASFKHYIANWSKGRSFVIYGHSQGTGHAQRLIKQEIDGNADLRKRLVSALLIGGSTTGTTFQNIPPCKTPEQFGCLIAYRTYGPTQSLSNIPAGLACTNPGALGGGKVKMKGSFFKSRGTNYSDDLGSEFTATWGLFRDFFTAECVNAPGGGQVLRIEYVESDMRKHFLDLSEVIGFGLHVFDYQFPLDDLIELVRTQRDTKLK